MPDTTSDVPSGPARAPRRVGARFVSLAGVPGAVGFFAASSLGRFGVAMSGLGLLWTVRHYSGSFATAGIVVGAFAFGEALLGPQAARAMDRYGQTRILPLLVAVHAIALALLVVGVVTGAHAVGLCVAAVLAGGSIPQSGSLSAVRWAYVLADPDLLVTAFSLEAVANDVAFLVGPAVVVAISALTWPVLGTAIAAALVLGGGVGLALQNSSAPPPAPRTEGQLRACDSGVRCLFSRGFAGSSGRQSRLGRAVRNVAGFRLGHRRRSSRGGAGRCRVCRDERDQPDQRSGLRVNPPSVATTAGPVSYTHLTLPTNREV